jgi:hypothetical protein
MPRIAFFLLLALLVSTSLSAGEPAAIETGTFVPETGWNRDDAALQYVAFAHGAASAHEFTWEWSARSDRHQFGWTVPMVTARTGGVGDATFNYRYQLAGSEERGWGVAPRLTVILPTRSGGLGGHVSGLQAAVPVSFAPLDRVSLHAVASVTRYRTGESELAVAPSVNVQLTSRITASVDSVLTRCSDGARSSVLRPAVQYAIDGPGGMRLVPGLALAAGDGERKLMLWLSLEQVFRN